MSKTIKILIAIGVILALGLIWQVTRTIRQPVGTLKFGFIGPLSGDAASNGITEKNAVQMAVDEINSKGGINGRKISIVYEDGKCNGKESLTAMEKLVSVDKVKIVLGGLCSGETLAAAPIAEKNHVLLFSAFSSNPGISNAGDYVFRNSPSDSDVAKGDAIYMASRYKSISIISENTDYAKGVHDILKQILTEKGLVFKNDEYFGGPGNDTTDFRSLLQKFKTANADVIYVNAQSGKTAGLIAKQIREIGIKTPIVGTFAFSSPDAASIAGANLEGIVFSNSSGLSNVGSAILKKYLSAFGKPANEYEMGASYDRVYILAQAISAVGYDVDKIKNYLYALKNYNGTIGNYHFDSNGDVVGVGFENYVIKNGQFVPVE